MRTTLDLTGWWDLAESADPARPPDHFPARVPVPGLIDLARPRLDKVGQLRYRFYWYRTTVTIPDQPHDRATLVIKKARYGTAVWLDDRPIGHHYGCFTRGVFPLGRLTAGPHHLVVRLGTPVTLPPWVPWGEDREKTRYIPGIYDDVVLWLSGSPHLENIRVGPRLAEGAVDVAVDLVNVHPTPQTTTLRLTVREAASGRLVGQTTVTGLTLGPGERQTIQPRLTIADPHPWSPEDPFLYTLECATDADQETVRFGLREFRYDRASRRRPNDPDLHRRAARLAGPLVDPAAVPGGAGALPAAAPRRPAQMAPGRYRGGGTQPGHRIGGPAASAYRHARLPQRHHRHGVPAVPARGRRGPVPGR